MSDIEYASTMAQVLATLVVAIAVIGRRTATWSFQTFQTVLHFVLGALGLIVLMMDILVLSNAIPTLILPVLLRKANVIAVGSLLLLMYTLAPFFQLESERKIEREARQIVDQRSQQTAAKAPAESQRPVPGRTKPVAKPPNSTQRHRKNRRG